ncbi:Non-specific lipid-transfer protein [Linum grandiflorum]
MATTITSSCLVMMIITVVVVPLPATAATVDRKSPPPPRHRFISYWALFYCDEREAGLEPCMAYVAGKVGPVVPARCCHAAKSFFYGVATSDKRYKRCKCWEQFPHTHPKLGEALVDRIPAGCGFHVPEDITSPANCPKHTEKRYG